ncbi:MAG: LD-carboxypeptidase [Candidatus Neomarinimicrobiota bacterium]|nr:MAG: LD-carboxypeptidase [Candidatus Neomarinimicrobiota bacterium]
MIKPPALQPGGTIGVLSPSYWFREEYYQKTLPYLTDQGYEVVRGDTTRKQCRQYAGTPEERAREIMDFFQNPAIDAILCARGGYGANRVLPRLDYERIRQHPKIFVGYSDITAFLLSITVRTGLITFHGPMLASYKNGFVPYNMDHFLKTVSGTFPLSILPPEDLPMHVLKPGTAEGPLWGGNMSLILDRLATPDQLHPGDGILFLEDVGEYYYAFDRMLLHFRRAGLFDSIRGLIIGEMTEMKDQEVPFGRSIDEIVLDVCGDLDIPIVSNFPCGHGTYQATLPESLPVRLVADPASPMLEFLEPPVEHESRKQLC